MPMDPWWNTVKKHAREARERRLKIWREHLKQMKEHSRQELYEQELEEFKKEFPNESPEA